MNNGWTPPDNKSELVPEGQKAPDAYANALSPQGDLWSPNQAKTSPEIQIIQVETFPTWAIWAGLGYLVFLIF